MALVICMVIMGLFIVGLTISLIKLDKYMNGVVSTMDKYTQAFNTYTAAFNKCAIEIEHNNKINDRIDADVKNLNALLLGPMVSTGQVRNKDWS